MLMIIMIITMMMMMMMRTERKRYEIALVMRRVTIFTIPEWFLVRQLFVYSTTLHSGTNRLLAF